MNHAGPNAGKEHTSVLFIGNSYTFFNEMPLMVERISAAKADRRPLRCRRETVGGWTLQRHYMDETSRALTVLRGESWDFVVLQDHSMQAIVKPDALEQYGRHFDEEIRARGAQTVFFMTWARQHAPEMQAAITREYTKAARACRARLAPVGEAWQAALAGRQGLVLHARDRSHPNAAGSYLTACVIYSTITASDPRGAPARAPALLEGNEAHLADLSADAAEFLQQTAWETVDRNRCYEPLA